MDTELLKTFLEVEKTRHFGRAAENLYLTPAAVSARIRQLEGIIGIPLLTRNKKYIGLTPAGERLKPRAQEVLDALSRAIDEPASTPRASQRFSVGGTPNLWDYCLTGELQKIRQALPEFSLRAECHDSGYLISQLQSRQLDIAFMFDPIALEGMSCDRVSTVEMALFSTDSGFSVDSHDPPGYVLVDWSVGFGIEHGKICRFEKTPVLISSTGRIALEYLTQNGGSAYFPIDIEHRGTESSILHRVPSMPTIQLGIFLLYLSSNRNLQLIEALRGKTLP